MGLPSQGRDRVLPVMMKMLPRGEDQIVMVTDQDQCKGGRPKTRTCVEMLAVGMTEVGTCRRLAVPPKGGLIVVRGLLVVPRGEVLQGGDSFRDRLRRSCLPIMTTLYDVRTCSIFAACSGCSRLVESPVGKRCQHCRYRANSTVFPPHTLFSLLPYDASAPERDDLLALLGAIVSSIEYDEHVFISVHCA